MKEDFDKMLIRLIKRRRSVRLFNGKKIPRNDVLSIIEAGIWAPTACNNQELRFMILNTEEELKDILKFKPFLKGVSTFILIFCDMSIPMSRKAYNWKGGRNLPHKDTGLALMNMILYAKSKNIDSCVCNLSDHHSDINPKARKDPLKKMINILKEKLGQYSSLEDSFIFYLKNHLKIPDHLKIMCGVAFGYAEKYPDVNKERHGGKKIMREKVDYYLLSKNN